MTDLADRVQTQIETQIEPFQHQVILPEASRNPVARFLTYLTTLESDRAELLSNPPEAALFDDEGRIIRLARWTVSEYVQIKQLLVKDIEAIKKDGFFLPKKPKS